MKPCWKTGTTQVHVLTFLKFLLTGKFRHYLRMNATSYHGAQIDFYKLITYASYITNT